MQARVMANPTVCERRTLGVLAEAQRVEHCGMNVAARNGIADPVQLEAVSKCSACTGQVLGLTGNECFEIRDAVIDGRRL